MGIMSEVFKEFEPALNSLDEMIRKLELNLGKKHSVSPFDALRKKFDVKPQPKKVVEEKKEEPEPVQEEQKASEQPKKEKKKKEPKEKKEKKPAEPEAEKLPDELEWWNTCDLRVGKIVECTNAEGSDKLYVEKIDLGEGKLRTIASGVRNHIPVEEMLADKFCVVFANLKEKDVVNKTIKSHGMVMCAGSVGADGAKEAIELIRPPAGSKIGERV